MPDDKDDRVPCYIQRVRPDGTTEIVAFYPPITIVRTPIAPKKQAD